MPKKNLPQDVLKWYHSTQQQLKERFDLDTTKREDMTRFGIHRVFLLPPEKPERDSGLEETDRSLLPLDFDITAQTSMEVKHQYAFIPSNAEGSDYVQPLAETGEDYVRQVVERQTTFNVTQKPNGEYEMESDLSEQQLMQLYESAKAGRVFACPPNTSIIATDSPVAPAYLLVDKDNNAAFVPTDYSSTAKLTDEQFKEYYDKHPEMLQKSMTNGDAVTESEREVGSLRNVENAEQIRNNNALIHQAFSGNCLIDGFFERMAYDVAMQQVLHEGGHPVTEEQFYRGSSKIPRELSYAKLPFDLESDDTLASFYVSDGSGKAKALFADLNDQQLSPALRKNEIYRRLNEHLEAGDLHVCTRQAETKDKLAQFDVRRLAVDEQGHVGLIPAVPPAPEKPGRWASFWHSINSNWYKSDFDEYEQAQRARTDALSMRDNFIPRAFRDEKERRAQLPKSVEQSELTRENIESKLASGVLADMRAQSAQMHYNTIGQTADDIMKSEDFQSFMQSPKMQGALMALDRGEKVKLSKLGGAFFEHQKERIDAEKQAKEPQPQNVRQQDQPVQGMSERSGEPSLQNRERQASVVSNK